MKTKLILNTLIALIAFQSTNAYSKTYFCGISGSLVQSEKPCSIPDTNPLIQPIKTDQINKDIINKTVDMLRKATKNRDVSAIERLLFEGFVFKSNEKNWEGREIFNTDKTGFVAVMTEHLLAITKYEQIIESYSIKTLQNELVAETESTEKISLGEKKIIARILERIKVINVNGFAKISSIKQVELK